jgi:putative transposase
VSRLRRGALEPLPPTGRETGSDVGLTVLLVTADGLAVENPRHFRTAEQALRRADRRVARRQQASHRREKAVVLRARKQQKVRRHRHDHHHTTALQLVRAYDTIYLDDVRVANMVRNPHLRKSIGDAGWAAWAGRRVLAVPPAYTSQDGSGCGERVPKRVSVRPHVCPSCGLVLDRDANAAQHLVRAGRARRGAVAVAAASKREAPSR